MLYNLVRRRFFNFLARLNFHPFNIIKFLLFLPSKVKYFHSSNLVVANSKPSSLNLKDLSFNLRHSGYAIYDLNHFFTAELQDSILSLRSYLSSKNQDSHPVFIYDIPTSHELLARIVDHASDIAVSILNTSNSFSSSVSSHGFMFSPNTFTDQTSSQYFHLDRTGFCTYKLFILLHDTSTESGPFMFYPKVQSEVIGRKSNYSKSGSNKRLTDHYLHSLVDTQPLIFTGNPGLCLLIDTDSCFHCGSRYAPQPRLMSLTRFTNILDFKIDNCFQIPFTS